MKNMRNSVRARTLNTGAEQVASFVRGVVDGNSGIPNNTVVLFSRDKKIFKIVTEKRLELIRIIRKYNPTSVNKLADLTDRKKQAVDRDLRLLESYNLIELEEKGKYTIPRVKRDYIILPLL